MKFIVTFSWQPDTETRNEGIARFLGAEGKPPAGVKLLGRWTRLDFSGGYVLLESDDPKALTEFALAWSDLMELEITPVAEDEQLAEVLQRKTGKRR